MLLKITPIYYLSLFLQTSFLQLTKCIFTQAFLVSLPLECKLHCKISRCLTCVRNSNICWMSKWIRYPEYVPASQVSLVFYLHAGSCKILSYVRTQRPWSELKSKIHVICGAKYMEFIHLHCSQSFASAWFLRALVHPTLKRVHSGILQRGPKELLWGRIWGAECVHGVPGPLLHLYQPQKLPAHQVYYWILWYLSFSGEKSYRMLKIKSR